MTDSPDPRRAPAALTYVLVWLALCALAAASLLASRASLGDWNVLVAFAIAAVKAALVLGVFMDLVYGPPLYRLVIGVAIGFVVVVILGVLADVGTRSIAGPDLDAGQRSAEP